MTEPDESPDRFETRGRPTTGRPRDPAARIGPTAAGRSANDRRLRRWVLAVVFAAGFAHAALYGAAFLPWAIEDEQQHVDYVWKIAFDRRLPTIEDEIDPSIVEGIFGTDRFGDYDMARPEPTPDSMGLQARSYSAFHPPGPYLVLAPAVAAVGERAVLVLYVLRFASALTAGAVALVTALLAIDLARLVGARRTTAPPGARLVSAAGGDRPIAEGAVDRSPAPDAAVDAAGSRTGRRVERDVHRLAKISDQRPVLAIAAAAGLSMAALPALADSGGRVNADIYATLVVVVGCRLLLRWVGDPTPGRSWSVGAVLAAAVLTRETALVLAVPALFATGHLARTRRLDVGVAARALAPPLLASLAWFGYQWRQSGHLDGIQAFLDTYGDIVSLPAVRPLAETVGDSLVVPYGQWGVPWLVVVGLVILVGVGLVLLGRTHRWVLAATAGAMLAFLTMAMLASVNRDLNIVTARLLLPAYPAVIAAATVGWATCQRREAAFALAVPLVVFGTWFTCFELLARYTPHVG